jgi:hypothetical protein
MKQVVFVVSYFLACVIVFAALGGFLAWATNAGYTATLYLVFIGGCAGSALHGGTTNGEDFPIVAGVTWFVACAIGATAICTHFFGWDAWWWTIPDVVLAVVGGVAGLIVGLGILGLIRGEDESYYDYY